MHANVWHLLSIRSYVLITNVKLKHVWITSNAYCISPQWQKMNPCAQIQKYLNLSPKKFSTCFFLQTSEDGDWRFVIMINENILKSLITIITPFFVSWCATVIFWRRTLSIINESLNNQCMSTTWQRRFSYLNGKWISYTVDILKIDNINCSFCWW